MQSDPAALFTRPFWLDELHVAFVANRDRLQDFWGDLWHSTETAPPLLPLAGWVLAQFNGTLTPTLARGFSLLCILIGLAFVWLILRRRFGLIASAAGGLAVAGNAVVITQAFEFRPYCLWFATAGAFAWSLGVDRADRLSTRRSILIGLSAALHVGSHWLAILSMSVIAAGAAIALREDWKAAARRLAPALCGVVAFLALTPLLLAQRESVSEATWLRDVTWGHVRRVLIFFWGGYAFLIGASAFAAGAAARATRSRLVDELRGVGREPSMTGLVATLLMPVLMMVMSLRLPMMLERYSVLAAFGWAPLLAVALHALDTPAASSGARAFTWVSRGIVVTGLVWLASFRVVSRIDEASAFTRSVAAARSSLAEACAFKLPVIFVMRHVLYSSTDGFSSTPAGCDVRYMTMSDDMLARLYGAGSDKARFFRFEKAMASIHESRYRAPGISPVPLVDTMPRFVLFGWESLPAGYGSTEQLVRVAFPGRSWSRPHQDFAILEK